MANYGDYIRRIIFFKFYYIVQYFKNKITFKRELLE